MIKRRTRRTFTTEFKNQMAQLFQNGKTKSNLIREYDLSPSSLDNWIGQSETSGFFKEKDNRTEEEYKQIELEKEIKHLRMENDILKQAALIKGRK